MIQTAAISLTGIKLFKNVFNKNNLVQSEQIAKQRVMMLQMFLSVKTIINFEINHIKNHIF